jgi:hypothetical protein
MQNLMVISADELNTVVINTGTLTTSISLTALGTVSLPTSSLPLSVIAGGTIGQVVVVNVFGTPIYTAQINLSNIPYGLANQVLQTTGTSNSWATLATTIQLGNTTLTLGAPNTATLAGPLTITGAFTVGSLSVPVGNVTIGSGALYSGGLISCVDFMATGSVTLPTASLPLDTIAGGTVGQLIRVDAFDTPVYVNQLNLSNIPFGLANQILRTSGTVNSWVTISGDATLAAGVLTVSNGAITNAKLVNATISLGSTVITLGAANTATLAGPLTITNAFTAGSLTVIGAVSLPASSIPLSVITGGSIGQVIVVNALGTPIFTPQFNLGNIPYGFGNQILQSTGAANNWVTMSGDATLAAGVLTVANGTITNAKLTNSTISLGSTVLTLGGANVASLAGPFNVIGLFTAGSINAPGTITSTNGSSVQGVTYSAIFGQANTTRSGQIAIIDGTSNNQYAQLFCRSNVFGVQGNITSISLQKNTAVTGTFSVSGAITLLAQSVALAALNVAGVVGTVLTSTGAGLTPTWALAPGPSVGRWSSKTFFMPVISAFPTYALLNSSLAPTTTVQATVTVRSLASYISVSFLSPINRATTTGNIWLTVGVSGGTSDITGGRAGGLFLLVLPGTVTTPAAFTYQFPATDVMAVAGAVTLQMRALTDGGSAHTMGNSSVLQFTASEVWN